MFFFVRCELNGVIRVLVKTICVGTCIGTEIRTIRHKLFRYIYISIGSLPDLSIYFANSVIMIELMFI